MTTLYRRFVPRLPDDVPLQTVANLARTERLVWFIIAIFSVVMLIAHAVIDVAFSAPTSVLVYEALRIVSAALAAIGVLGLTRRRFVHVARELDHLRRAEVEKARLEGALLAARTAAHRINNALSPMAGYAELLMVHDGIRADPTARLFAQQISDAALTAAQEIGKLQQIVRLQEDAIGQTTGLPVLDLERSSMAADTRAG